MKQPEQITMEFVFSSPLNKYDTTHITLTENIIEGDNRTPEDIALSLYNRARRMYEVVEAVKRNKGYQSTTEKEARPEVPSKTYTNENNELGDLPF